jgi:hypothetical protein
MSVFTDFTDQERRESEREEEEEDNIPQMEVNLACSNSQEGGH